MYNFQQHLDTGEKILYQGQAIPGKGSKNIGGLLFIIGFVLVIQILIILSVRFGGNRISLSLIIIFLTTLLFDGIAIYGLIYSIFLKKKAVADDFYCLTNKRAFKYELSKNKLVFGYLAYYEDMKVVSVKDNCGDLYMGIIFDNGNNASTQDLKTLKELMLNPNPENMPSIAFEAIENPNQVLELAQKARMEILKTRG